MPFVSTTHHQHHGKVIGTGHCVPFVQQVAGVPNTSQWRRGDPVKGSSLSPGTAIATFDPNGRYGNHTDGRSHAAILLSENTDGLLVMDQWVGNSAKQRTIRFRNGQGDAANDGDRYYVIEVA